MRPSEIKNKQGLELLTRIVIGRIGVIKRLQTRDLRKQKRQANAIMHLSGTLYKDRTMTRQDLRMACTLIELNRRALAEKTVPEYETRIKNGSLPEREIYKKYLDDLQKRTASLAEVEEQLKEAVK